MRVIFASVLLCCSVAALAESEVMVNADDTPVEHAESDVGLFNIVLAAAVTLGGDDFAVASNDQTVSAGGLLYLAAGGVYHASSAMDIQATLGVHVDAIEATNGSVEFTRSFFELMPFYVTASGNRFGVGVAHVMSPELTTPVTTTAFDDANGMIVEYDWMLARHFFLGVRFADLTYDVTNGFVELQNGENVAAVEGGYFGVIIQGHF